MEKQGWDEGGKSLMEPCRVHYPFLVGGGGGGRPREGKSLI